MIPHFPQLILWFFCFYSDDDELSFKISGKRENKDSDDTEMPKEKKNKSINFVDMLPRITVHTVDSLEMCTHEVAMPPEMKYIPLVQSNGKPAKEYKFILDPFQKEAILCIANNQSVLVSAHTSAGKTVVAEWEHFFLNLKPFFIIRLLHFKDEYMQSQM